MPMTDAWLHEYAICEECGRSDQFKATFAMGPTPELGKLLTWWDVPPLPGHVIESMNLSFTSWPRCVPCDGLPPTEDIILILSERATPEQQNVIDNAIEGIATQTRNGYRRVPYPLDSWYALVSRRSHTSEA